MKESRGSGPPQEAHLQARKGGAVLSQMRPHFHLSRRSEAGHSSISFTLRVSTPLGGLLGAPRCPREELPRVVFSLSFLPFEFSALTFILMSFPEGRCWWLSLAHHKHISSLWVEGPGVGDTLLSQEGNSRLVWVIMATHCSLQ